MSANAEVLLDTNGLILESPYAQYQFLIKGPMQKVWKDGFPVDEQKIIPLQFDRYICFVDDMAAEQEWTVEDREFVARAIDASLNNPKFRDMWVHEAPKPPLPWPTYESMHHSKIATAAEMNGLVGEAFAYETRGREGGPRPAVVKKLQALLDGKSEPDEPDAPEPDDDLVAA